MKRVETSYVREPGDVMGVMVCWGINGDIVESVWVMRWKRRRGLR